MGNKNITKQLILFVSILLFVFALAVDFPTVEKSTLKTALNDSEKSAFVPTLKSKVNKLLGVDRINGISLGMHSESYCYDYDNMLTEISQLNTEWVCINTFFQQEDINADVIKNPPPNSPYWRQLEETLRHAKNNNLRVMLMPIVLLEHAEAGEWRGRITPKDKANWFISYGEILQQLARLAAETDTELLAIGSEYVSMQGDSCWLELIDSVKTVYDGGLTYSCNWDAIENICFLGELDLLGLNGYFPLSSESNPCFHELKATWTLLKNDLLALQTTYNIPFFFSEVGYASVDGISSAPWNYYVSETVDLAEQKACFEAFYETWIDEPNFYGVFFYEWFGKGGRCDGGYTFKDKPALEVIKRWMGDGRN